MGLGKPTEMSLRDLLIEELKHRGVTVVPEVSFRSVDGRRLVPDLVLRDGASYVVVSIWFTSFRGLLLM